MRQHALTASGNVHEMHDDAGAQQLATALDLPPAVWRSADLFIPKNKTSQPAIGQRVLTAEQRQVLCAAIQVSANGTKLIRLTGQQLKTVPEWLRPAAEAADVREILLNQNGLREFPNELAGFRKLERLSLGSNQIDLIPDIIGDMKSLQWLDFTHNRVAQVSERIAELPRLASVGASDCRLAAFPLAFTKMRRIKKLGVFNNVIGILPREIGNMTTLTKLDLSGNSLRVLPAEIGKLVNLTWLNVSNNQLLALPDEMGNLTELQELGLAHNRLTSLPDLGRLHQLQLLTAYGNQIAQLGDWICQLPSLAKVDLSSNRLGHLPEKILCLRSLELLNVRGNRLVDIPVPNPRDFSKRASKLATLDVRDNELVSMPLGVLSDNMKELRCSGNPFLRQRFRPYFAVASLGEMALQLLSNKTSPSTLKPLPPILKATMLRLREGSLGHCCQNCHHVFIQPPLRLIEYREASDEQVAPFLVYCCSAACWQSYKKTSPEACPYYQRHLDQPSLPEHLPIHGSQDPRSVPDDFNRRHQLPTAL